MNWVQAILGAPRREHTVALSRHPPDDRLPNPSLQPADGIFKSWPSPGMPGCSIRRRDRGAAFGKLRNCLHQGAPLSWVMLELMATDRASRCGWIRRSVEVRSGSNSDLRPPSPDLPLLLEKRPSFAAVGMSQKCQQRKCRGLVHLGRSTLLMKPGSDHC